MTIQKSSNHDCNYCYYYYYRSNNTTQQQQQQQQQDIIIKRRTRRKKRTKSTQSTTTRPLLLLQFVSIIIIIIMTSTAVPRATAIGINNSPQIRIVSYNILSSQLASPSHYTTLNPDHLNASNRLSMILQKLEDEISGTSTSTTTTTTTSPTTTTTSPPTPPIICLQEVSQDFAGSLHTFFSNKGYHFITGLYGKKYNGYMGIGIAYPISTFNTINVDICRLSDKRIGGWPRPPIIDNDDNDNENKQQKLMIFKNNPFTNIIKTITSTIIQSIVISPYQKLRLTLGEQQQQTYNKEPIEPWDYSEYRLNQMISIQLQEKQTQKTFWIGNYHMPCAFYSPPVMTIHSEMAAKHIQTLAAATNNNNNNKEEEDEKKEENTPYIFVGDFNIKPSDPMYQLLTTGKLQLINSNNNDNNNNNNEEESDNNNNSPNNNNNNNINNYIPPIKYGMEWKSTIEPMTSVYAEYNKQKQQQQQQHSSYHKQYDFQYESDFTNYARIKDDPPFIDTLDYIFISKYGWNINSVKQLPTRYNSGGPFPNLDRNEPSDHILIASTLQFK